jgi:hypothetical protein
MAIKRSLDTANEISHVFQLPGLLQVDGDGITERITVWQKRITESEQQLNENQRKIDDVAFQLYGFSEDDRRAIEITVTGQDTTDENDTELADEDEGEDDETPLLAEAKQLVIALLSYAVGCVFGRWNIQFATGDKSPPVLPDPYAPLPVCSPGMLTDADGLLLSQAPPEYPIAITWDGILVDDQNHPNDIVRRVQQVLELIWQKRTNDVEQEACEILGVRDLQNYFQRPTNFFQDHWKRYFKSKRKAPVY